MDLQLGEAHLLLQRNARAFLKQRLAPIVDEYERRQEFPKFILSDLGELGFLGVTFPEQYGGSELGHVGLVVFAEEIGRVCQGVSSSVLTHLIAANAVCAFGREDQKQEYLVPAIQGQKLCAIAITEPNHGSNVAGLETLAREDGDDFVLNGSKMFITNSHQGDFLVVAAKTDPERGRRGVSLLLVDKPAAGLRTSPLEKLGWHSGDTAEVSFADVRVPKDRLLGERGRGFYHIMADFTYERILMGGMATGLAQAALDAAVAYAQSRTQFGQPIGGYQAVSHKLVDMAVQVHAARQMSYHAAWLADQGVDAVKEASMVKLYSSEVANRVCYEAIQIHGGYGFMAEYPVTRYYRDARVLTIAGGTSEIQREIIARRMDLGGSGA